MIGKTIGNRYLLRQEIGAGGMGTVFLGEDTRHAQLVAVKYLKPALATPDLIERFRREGEALRKLNHPNIVGMLESVEEDGDHYLVMEYVGGGDLSDILDEGFLSVEQVMSLAIDICDALTRAHRLGIIHRDLKPPNVLIASDGTPRLTDFGIAHVVEKERVTETGAIVGTLDYVPPEALNGDGIDTRADIWAFGVMLFEMLAGERPFAGDSAMQVIKAIATQPIPDLEALQPAAPIELVDLVYRMLERDRDARISSMRYVGAALEDILHGRAVRAFAETRFAPPTPDALRPPLHNLPAQTTSFVGRAAELAALSRLLDDPKVRLVTIVGPGGMGKTRLALETAATQLSRFRDGVFLVELAPLSEVGSILTATADAVGYQFQTDGREQKQQLLDYLRHKNVLLVLDNFEHLMAGATFATDVLRAASGVKILATSRQRLNQSGEQLFSLEGMDFPAWETPDDALEFAAVKLFLQSARRAVPEFTVTADNMDFIARICKLVQGMPLGILLAASWVSMLGPDEIADEMQRNIDFLESDMGDLPQRHRSIRAVCDYSWQLMTEREQQLFARLSVFQGGFTREAAQAVADADLRTLMSLANKSVIARDAESGRYTMHELLRQYAQHQLGTEESQIKDAHLQYFLAWAEETVDKEWGSDAAGWFQQTERELPNVQVAIARAVEDADAEIALRLVNALWWYWFRHGSNHEARDYFQQALALPHKETATRALAFLHMGVILAQLGDFGEAMRLQGEAGRLADQFDVPAIKAMLAWTHTFRTSDYDEAVQLFERALALLGNHEDDNRLSAVMNSYGDRVRVQGDLDRSEQLYQECLALSRKIHFTESIVDATGNLGRIALLKGDYDRAADLIGEAVQVARRSGTRMLVGHWLIQLGTLELYRGHLDDAERHISDSLAIQSESGQIMGTGHARHLLAYVALQRSDMQQAAQLLAESLRQTKADETNLTVLEFLVVRLLLAARLALAWDENESSARFLAAGTNLRDQINYRLEPFVSADFETAMQTAKQRLGEVVYEAMWSQGQALDPPAAQDEALQFVERHPA